MIAGKGCLVLAAVLLAGCAGSIPVRVERPTGNVLEPAAAPTAKTLDNFRGIPGKYRKLAASAEKAGALRRALLYRKVVNGFAPEDADAREDVERLERKIRGQVDRHYRNALALEESGENEKALREFLAVLVLDPDHEAALRWVKNGQNRKNGKNGGAEAKSRSWTVREGDTLRKIAGEVYRDPDKEFLIAYFNRLPKGSPLSIGTELRLPDVDAVSSTMTMTEKVPGYSRPEKERNAHQNAVERKEDAERKLREADAHYAAGMRSFLAEDLEEAIREWEKTLSLDPAHPKALRDIEKARRLKEKIESQK
jgi:tetratricopeptide (TPR) repeat protein